MVVLCGDIGGTNANFCLANKEKRIEIGHIDHFPTQEFHSFPDLVNRYLEMCEESPESACFAVAGVVKDQCVKMTNADLVVDAREIMLKTPLKTVKVINDFDAVGYATNTLDPSDVVILNKGLPEDGGMRCALGAGTGLGKSILFHHSDSNTYIPSSSEGGHTDFPIGNPEEWIFVENLNQATWENLISGKGIEHIYQALQKHQYPDQPVYCSAKEISKRRHESPLCRETFQWFIKFYARAARNFTIELLAKGGVYLAGGIGASNSDMFGNVFMDEFTRHQNPQYREILQNIPITLIKNYDISLKGAAFVQFV